MAIRCRKCCDTTKMAAVIVFLALYLSGLDRCVAVDYTVGGAAGFWDIPSVSKINYTMWALWNDYFVGDALYFRYEKGDHSVLEVTFKDYQYCRNARPLASYAEGNTRILLDRYGPYYFICGTPDHCYLGQKFNIDVSDHFERENAPPEAPAWARRSPKAEQPAEEPAEDHQSTSIAPNNPGSSDAAKIVTSIITLLMLTSLIVSICYMM